MQRIVMHVDMNSYFASVEQQANPFLRGKPIGVTGKAFDLTRQTEAQRSIIATASREAKKLGVRTAMSTVEAKRICPSLIIVPGDPEKYSDMTHRFVQLFYEFTDHVEQASVDECYLDVTKDADDYFGATIMAQIMRERLKEICGEYITASIGIGPNKLIAKLGSESHKPNGLTVIPPEQVMDFLDTRQLSDFCGIGYRTEQHLAELGITTVQGLRDADVNMLTREFKSWGIWLHEAAFGRDHFPVVATQRTQKSIGHSYTFPHDITSTKELKRNLLAMADKVAWRLRRDGMLAGLVSVYFRYSHSQKWDLSKSSSYKARGSRRTSRIGAYGEEAAGPRNTAGGLFQRSQQHRFAEPTADGLQLFKIAWSLVEKWWDGAPVRLIGITAGMLSQGREARSLFKEKQKTLSVTGALDKIQSRYGSGSWTRASTTGVTFRARSSGWHYDHEI